MAKRKEIKWRREGRGTMTGRQDGIIFRIFRLWDAQERGHTVNVYYNAALDIILSNARAQKLVQEFEQRQAPEICTEKNRPS